MTPDDPRHGTYAGDEAHKRAGVPLCEPCRLARNEYARGRYNDRVMNRRRTYPPVGFRRRVEALQAIGWSLDYLASRIGVPTNSLRNTAFHTTRISARRHLLMVALFDKLSMHVPTDPWANRRRTIARRKGYAPPLAWDDIDDPDEQPDLGDRRQSATILENYNWLTTHGESHEQACKRLGVTDAAIDKARSRARKEAA